MRRPRPLWFGFLIGFLFGIVGIWILAMLSLMFIPIELFTQPLFTPGKWVASLLMQDGSVTTAQTVLLFLVNGVFYGLMGMAIQGVRGMGRR